jgi:hypothetical protein
MQIRNLSLVLKCSGGGGGGEKNGNQVAYRPETLVTCHNAEVDWCYCFWKKVSGRAFYMVTWSVEVRCPSSAGHWLPLSSPGVCVTCCWQETPFGRRLGGAGRFLYAQIRVWGSVCIYILCKIWGSHSGADEYSICFVCEGGASLLTVL